jgi:hypothetical protein
LDGLAGGGRADERIPRASGVVDVECLE